MHSFYCREVRKQEKGFYLNYLHHQTRNLNLVDIFQQDTALDTTTAFSACYTTFQESLNELERSGIPYGTVFATQLFLN